MTDTAEKHERSPGATPNGAAASPPEQFEVARRAAPNAPSTGAYLEQQDSGNL